MAAADRIDRTPPAGFIHWRPDVCSLCVQLDCQRDLWVAGYTWDEKSLMVPARSEQDLAAHRAEHKADELLSLRGILNVPV